MSDTNPCPEIFCNRAINMEQIKAVGFDMDYTMAEYISETFDLLAYNGAVKKLIARGYPEEIAKFEYDPNAYQRGLVLDKKRGNVLKMDRHKYVKIAYHGLTRLDSAERKSIYSNSFETQVQFIPPDYASCDTNFMLVDLVLYCQLVDYKDKHPDVLPQGYDVLYKHVRQAVDLCHCDGEIKDKVALDPPKYIKPSPDMPRMLSQLRAGGKQVFLLTNSLYDFTDVVMRFLLGDSWKDHFDLIICGARKPGFLLDSYLPLFLVREDQSLENIDVALDAAPGFNSQSLLQKSKVFQGGNWNHLHRLLGLSSGSQLMYVGDHMYSDILRSKRTLGWRTVLIIPELDREVSEVEAAEETRRHVQELQAERATLQRRVDEQMMTKLRLQTDGAATAKLDECEAALQELWSEMHSMNEELTGRVRGVHEAVHPVWGQLLKAGQQNSKWAQQVQTYACLYTSHVTNLAYISPDTRFRVYSDMMPHDRAAFDKMNPKKATGVVNDGLEEEAAFSQNS